MRLIHCTRRPSNTSLLRQFQQCQVNKNLSVRLHPVMEVGNAKKVNREVGNARKVDRAKILARVAQRQSSGPLRKRPLRPHSFERPRSSLRAPTLGSIPESIATEDDVVLVHHSGASDLEDHASGSMTTFAADKYCPDWDVKVSNSMFTREMVVEMMSQLIPPSDRTTVSEATSEALCLDGYELLAKQLLNHHGMVRKINYGSRRIRELAEDLA